MYFMYLSNIFIYRLGDDLYLFNIFFIILQNNIYLICSREVRLKIRNN